MDILREIETKILFLSNGRSISKIGITEFFLQMIIDVKGNYIKKNPSNLQHFVPVGCDIFYVLRSYLLLTSKNGANVEPLSYNVDNIANFGFITENQT